MLERFNFSLSHQETIKTGRFLVFFVIFYLGLSAIGYGLFGLAAIELFVARTTLIFLNTLGHSGTVIVQEPAIIQLESGTAIAISELCTGLMELLIIVSAILASHGILWKSRVQGAIAGAILVVVFNFFRIILTSSIILAKSPPEIIEFTHNILFRVFLFVVIAGTYVVWFSYAIKKEQQKTNSANQQ